MPIKSDSRRLPRRNDYQEGPGYLFVAVAMPSCGRRVIVREPAERGRIQARGPPPREAARNSCAERLSDDVVDLVTGAMAYGLPVFTGRMPRTTRWGQSLAGHPQEPR